MHRIEWFGDGKVVRCVEDVEKDDANTEINWNSNRPGSIKGDRRGGKINKKSK